MNPVRIPVRPQNIIGKSSSLKLPCGRCLFRNIVTKLFPGDRSHCGSFRTIVAAGLPVHVVIFQFSPPLFQFLAPEVFSSCPRITPGKMIVVKTVIFIVGHPVSASITGTNFLCSSRHALKSASGWARWISLVPRTAIAFNFCLP